MSVAAEEVIVTKVPKRDLHRMQRIFRGSKAKLTARPFEKESSVRTAVTLTAIKALTAALTADEISKALADADPTPAIVAEMSARAARFGVPATSAAAPSAAVAGIPAVTLTEEEKAARDELLKKRAERFGAATTAAASSSSVAADLSELVAKIDPAVLDARASRFADPRAEAEKAAAEARAARFGVAADTAAANNSKKKNNAAPTVPKPAPIELTPEQQAALDARARRFGA